uniref:Polyisoprenoid-binding protein YceI n=1 Tax=Candidatus Kentrum sp. UNK TaxID=2126344 RepID=A0A451AL02_9GAMM|nr:MAG: Polyisoprenoid-binding protein YceI [Candidatus Kentron sp. UNK]VFK72179.1 MAG: Polyisoprenoid-binding protein YceI [Candidatus Kentron sp. UNK]
MKKLPKRRLYAGTFAIICLALGSHVFAADYRIDDTHSFVQFRIRHLGFSWMDGRFNHLSGHFRYDANKPENNRIAVEIDTASIDTNHAERDKRLRERKGFLETKHFPVATFKSTKYTGDGDKGTLTGDLTLHGITKTVTLSIQKVGEGKDPWGGYRAGFIGNTILTREDFGIDYKLGPGSETIELELGIEGIRQ